LQGFQHVGRCHEQGPDGVPFGAAFLAVCALGFVFAVVFFPIREKLISKL